MIIVYQKACLLPACPQCEQAFTYEAGALLVCPMCGHEWSAETIPGTGPDTPEPVICDGVGNVLTYGDTVTIMKDLKVKGAGGVVKVRTKVTGIRLVEDGIDDHDIDARVAGFGQRQLKSSVVKKAV